MLENLIINFNLFNTHARARMHARSHARNARMHARNARTHTHTRNRFMALFDFVQDYQNV